MTTVMEQLQKQDPSLTTTGNGTVAVLFIHGFLDDQSVWDDVVSELAAADVQLLRLDLAGMGDRSGDEGPYSLERYADDVARVVGGLDRPVVIVAQSMGTLVAELVGVRHPDKVVGAVLLTPVPLAGTHLPEEAVGPFRQLGGNTEAQRGVRKYLGGGLNEFGLDKLTYIGDRIRPEVVTHLVDCWNEGIPDAPVESEFSSPVLIIRGEADPFATAELVSTAVSPRFRRVHEEVLSEAGHWPHVEQPRNVAGLIGRFLTDISEAPATAPGEANTQGWINAFASKSADDFGEAFHRDVVLEASVMRSPITGRENVKAVMSAASSIYESLEFTQQTVNGPRTYLEWHATAFGGLTIDGVTILTKDESGQIVSAAIHHRPLEAALRFSAELGKRIGKAMGESRFYSTE
ncbi:pimeloyl-ACP methyl ester carboxylesterase [Pseudarthrobacter sp. W1I19]|uniref:alpha/beta fold hydrolase n=1 Tax=Pseudarthrobacter sp. W1I19 TaxID=3042288 RepID=UPI0027869FDB|nr:alpha/beta fold hydrolase [Pseudarthrobacter sp. W1I19]MDQ0924504.1 pimeloyl-ACP methyl ester carboxylesterase [Pseudarthrobacter sp. W1I19]